MNIDSALYYVCNTYNAIMYVKSVIFLVEKNICKLFSIIYCIVVYFPKYQERMVKFPLNFHPVLSLSFLVKKVMILAEKWLIINVSYMILMFETGKYVDVLVSANGTFLEHLSSGTLKFKILDGK